MHRKGITPLTFFLGVVFMTSALAANDLALVPQPREIERLEGTTALSPDWTISIQDLHPDDAWPAAQIADDVKTLFDFSWKVEKSIPEKNYILLKGYTLKGDEPDLFKEQGYSLRIEPDRVIIEATSATGRFYGAQTLRQLLRAATESRELPRLRITDYPALEWRGISDDISRGQVSTVENFRDIIRTLAYYKKNLYQPYIEDMFRFDVSPNVGADRGALTKEEMAQLVEEAKRNHITLTPVFETLGHQDRLLGLPENRKYAEVQDPDKTPWSFAPVSEEAYEFVTKLVDEMAKATPNSPFFHIGGDESWDVGEGLSKEAVDKYGVGKVHADYYSRLVKYIAEKYNRQTMLYGDMLLRYPDALGDLAKGSIIVDWHYHPAEDYPSIQTIKEAGVESIFVSPGIWSWANFYPNYYVAFQNVGNFIAAGKRENVMGSITSSWGDRGAENLRDNNWVGWAFSAACEWQVDNPGRDEFLADFMRTHFGLASPSLVDAFTKIGWLDYLESNYYDGMFHRRLRIKFIRDDWKKKMVRLEKDMGDVMEAIDAERDKARFNADQLDGPRHAARRYLYMARRDQDLDRLAHLMGNQPVRDMPEKRQREVLATLEKHRNELLGITHEFAQLWLRDNKFPKLDFNLTRLNDQVANLQHLLVLGIDGVLQKAPPPQGTWFWYPEKDPRQETPTAESPKFLRVFQLEEIPLSAELKCWADDRATVYLNGRRIFRTTYPEDPKSESVRERLKVGENIIALDARNSNGAAGILFELHMLFADGRTVLITGDDQWRTVAEVKGDWMSSPPSGESWKPVMLLGTGPIEPWGFINW